MIFNLFKSKPTLKELIPDGFVDIHSHILPGLDDGAKNIKESLLLIKEMKKLGFTKIIGTPHTYPDLYDNTNESIEKSYNRLLPNINNGVKISYSSEYLLGSYLIEKAREKKIIPIKDKYILVEMSYLNKPYNLHEIIFNLIHYNYTPILAHPERYLFLHNDFKQYYKLKKLGCLFQINLLSTTGYYGRNVTLITEKLLKNNLVDFVGSDIHKINEVRSFYTEKIKIYSLSNFKKSIRRNMLFS